MKSNSIRTITGTNRSECLTSDAALKQLPIRKNLYPQNQLWRENLIGKNPVVNSSTNDGETLWVTKTTSDAKELSRQLLEENSSPRLTEVLS